MKKHRLIAPLHQRSFLAQVIIFLVFAITSSSPLFCLTPLEELQELAKLSREDLIKPENLEKIAQATLEISEQQISAEGRKAAAKTHAEALKIAAELKEVAQEMRATVSPS